VSPFEQRTAEKTVAAWQLDDVVRPAGSGGHLHNGQVRRLGRLSDPSQWNRRERFDERATSETNADHADLPEKGRVIA